MAANQERSLDREPVSLTLGQEPKSTTTNVENTFVTVVGGNDAVKNSEDTDNENVAMLYDQPNGGWTAWLQVAGSFCLSMNSWGTVNSFGVFQTYYENNPLWSANPSTISWIGSVQAFLLLLIGVLTGPAFDAGYFRPLVLAGTFLVPFGFMMTSLCTEYWQTMLAQGIVVGIGNGCLFIPAVAILPQYFSSKKALVNGIAAAGSSLGGIVYPILFRRLQLQIGFQWATRVMAFIIFALLLFGAIVMKPRFTPREKRHLTQLSAFKEVPYSLFAAAMTFAFCGFYGPVYYIQSYAIEKQITDEQLGFYLLPILNAASIPGRVVPNFISDYAGPLNIMTLASFATGIMALVWIAIHNLGGIIGFAIIYGFVSGAFVSLPPVAVVTLTTDMRTLGTRMGQIFFIAAFGLLIGAPISGAILSSTGSYLGLQLFSGFCLMTTGVLVVAARINTVGWKVKVKA